MQIAIIHNQPSGNDAFGEAERGVVEVANWIANVLGNAGHETLLFAAGNPQELFAFLTRQRIDLVFNCCESFQGRARREMNVAAMFDLFGMPYTGSSALTLGITLDKGLAKAVLSDHGIATPMSVRLEPGVDLSAADLPPFPLIVKPVAEDASIGIDDGAVVSDRRALDARVHWVWTEFQQAALVEEFIDGREFNVSLLAVAADEFVALPPAEITFEGLPPGIPRIVGYEAKWMPGSMRDRGTPVRCPAELEPDLAAEVWTIALSAARAIGLRDYGRVDLRMRDRDRVLFVLEVNANPDLDPQAGFIRAAVAGGLNSREAILEIVARAAERAGLADASAHVRSLA